MNIKFQTIKKNAIMCFVGSSGGKYGEYISSISDHDPIFLALYAAINCGQKPRDIINEWLDYGVKLIENWDVRMVKKLIELFPDCVPTHCRKKSIIADYDESGNWIVCFQTPACS